MSLRTCLDAIGDLSSSVLSSNDSAVALGDLVRGSVLCDRVEELRGRSVLIATRDQLSAALALIDLDGVARRLVLCASDFRPEHLLFVVEAAGVEAIVSDGSICAVDSPVEYRVASSLRVVPACCDHRASHRTEWVLLTSGTTGAPKLVVHTLSSLSGAIQPGSTSGDPVVWSTFYDIRRYGGLQVFLRAILTGASLVLSDAGESTADFLARVGSLGVTHVSGTPSHWRKALMSPSARILQPRYVRLSGEVADQAILSQIQLCYPQALVAHAFASTEAGVAFDVTDGLAGFPASLVNRKSDVELKIEEGSLRIRSQRTAIRYLGKDEPLTASDSFVDTGDIVRLEGDRYYFAGRRDGTINVGGLKVHPEEVEAVINRHPEVQMALVRTRKNPVTGGLVVADVVLKKTSEKAGNRIDLQNDIQRFCRELLPVHKVPAIINFVSSLAVAETGKLMRRYA